NPAETSNSPVVISSAARDPAAAGPAAWSSGSGAPASWPARASAAWAAAARAPPLCYTVSRLGLRACAPNTEIRPARIAPISGRKTIAWIIRDLTLHQIDVFKRDRAAIAIVHDQHRKTDRRLRRRHREHQQREHLTDDVAQEGRERHQVDIDREQDQFDRHQDDDDVLAVEKDAENPEREQDRADREIVSETDRHCTHSGASASCRPCPDA